MKLHSHMKNRKKVQRCLSLLLILCLAFSEGSQQIALAGAAADGEAYHQHDDSCYEEVLICDLEEQGHNEECYEEEQILVCTLEEGEEHQHSESCYETVEVLVCEKEEQEHEHTEECYELQLVCGLEEHIPEEEFIDTDVEEEIIDVNVDMEDEDLWDEMFAHVEWTDSWGEDLVTAARTQIGYRESEKNYAEMGNGSRKGYTRYGHFTGNPYADWDAAFVNFCLYYAGIAQSGLFPGDLDAATWYQTFALALERNADYLASPEGFSPMAGDIVFFKRPVEIEEIPAETQEPEESETPTESEEPAENENPAETEEPVETETPDQTEAPDQSEAPAQTEGPAESETPVQTKEPAQTEAPAESEVPAQTETPVQNPAESTEPTQMPAQTETPAGSDAPAQSEGLAETPVQTGEPAESVTPVQTEAPAEPIATVEPSVSAETTAPAPTAAPTAPAVQAEETAPVTDASAAGEGQLVELAEDTENVTTEWKMGIVSSYNAETGIVTVVEGDSGKEVRENAYSENDSEIVAYLKLTELEAEHKGNLRELKWEDEFVEIVVTAKEENAIPAGATLRVVPILKEAEETKEKYQEVEAQLQQKVQQDAAEFNSSEEFDIEMEAEVVGFLAYDIAIVTVRGEEIEPESGVVVSMCYKAAAQPEEVENVEDELSMTVMHLEEDETGEVKEVVNMAEQELINEMTTTEDQKVESIEFETDSFSTYAVTWTNTTLNVTTRAATSAKNTPVHHKYIKRNAASDGSTNNYTVSLDVVGKVEKKTIDILLIVDASNSMKDENSEGVTRYSQVQTAINNMIASAKTQKSDTVTINVGIVEFSDGYNKTGDFDYGSPYYQWTKDGKTYLGGSAGTWFFPRSTYKDGSKVPDQAYQMKDTKPDAVQKQAFKDIAKMGSYKISKFGCGTNWQAGIQEAEKMLAGRNNETYVIFLTDGLPTVRYKDGYRTKGACSDDYYKINTVGFTGDDNPNYKAAVTQWGKSTKLKAAKTYVVYAGDTACKNRCNAFAKSIGAENNKTALNGTSATALKNSFNSILKNITGLEYTDVVIQDTLSAYVDYAYKSIAAKNFVVYENSTKLTLNTDYTIAFSGTGNKTFKVTIKRNGGKLKNNATYRVQINVIPSETAIKYALQNNNTNYPHTGDAGTDGPGTVSPQTSSGKKGFYSNDNANTKLTYKAAGVAGSAPYEKPVIQVETTTWAVEKKWVGDKADSVTVTLKATRKDTGAEIGYINTLLKDKKLQDVTLNASNTWKYTWNNLPKYYYYYDAKGNAQHTPVVYTVTEKDVTKTEGSTSKSVMKEYTQGVQISGNKTTITNTRKGILYVEKNWTDGEANHTGDEIKVGLYKKDGTPATTGDIYGNKVLTLNAGNQWGKDRKEYFALGVNVAVTDYIIKELKVVTGNDFDFEVDGKRYKGIEQETVTKIGSNRYLVTYSYSAETDGGKVMVTNTPVPSWQLIKRSSTDKTLTLEGAKFALTGAKTYIGVSDANGVVRWTDPNGMAVEEKDIEDGTYVLTETEAPQGYGTGEPWNITITNGILSIEGQVADKTDGILRFYYENTLLYYELPSTGGHGIYWYVIGGTALLMAGILILYKKKMTGGAKRVRR